MKTLLRTALTLAALFPAPAFAGGGFDVVVLGATGGIQDGNLSAFLIKPRDDPRYVTCDAGALVNGLIAAEAKGAFTDVAVPADSAYSRVGYVLTDRIKGYLVSHAHADHIMGLVIASPDDSKKPIYGLPSVLEDIEQNYFNWQAWPNFGDAGAAPALSKYHYQSLVSGEPVAMTDTAMSVMAFPLSHSGVESTAFLIESGGDALLCFGDTGPDSVEKSTALAEIWTAVAPKLRDGSLKAIIIETSFASSVPDNLLFGHLTPKYLLESLHQLNDAAGGEKAIAGLPVLVSHIKYSLKSGPSPAEQIKAELDAGNDLGVTFILPEQGDTWSFE